MSLQGALAVLWLFGSVGLMVAFAYFLAWLDDRAERRKEHHAAE